MGIKDKCYACNKSGGRFELPKDRQQREKWLIRLNVQEPMPGTTKKICLRHFRNEDIKKGEKRVDLKKNVLPIHYTLHPSTETQDG